MCLARQSCTTARRLCAACASMAAAERRRQRRRVRGAERRRRLLLRRWADRVYTRVQLLLSAQAAAQSESAGPNAAGVRQAPGRAAEERIA